MSLLAFLFAFLIFFCIGRSIGRLFRKNAKRPSLNDRHPPWEIAVGIWALIGLIVYLFDIGAA